MDAKPDLTKPIDMHVHVVGNGTGGGPDAGCGWVRGIGR